MAINLILPLPRFREICGVCGLEHWSTAGTGYGVSSICPTCVTKLLREKQKALDACWLGTRRNG